MSYSNYYFNRTYTKEAIDTSCIQDRLKTVAISSGNCERSQHVEEATELKELRGLQHSGNSALIWTYNRPSNPSSSRNDAQQKKINSHKNKPTWSKVFEDNPACSSSRVHTYYEQNANAAQQKKINSHKNKTTWSKVFEENPACSSSQVHTYYEQNANDAQQKKIKPMWSKVFEDNPACSSSRVHTYYEQNANDAQQKKINSHKNKPTWSKVFEDNPACSSSRVHTYYEQNANDAQQKKINSHKNKPTLLKIFEEDPPSSSSRVHTNYEQNAKIVSMKPISWDSKNPSEETGKQTEVEDEELMVRMEEFRLNLENIFSEGVKKLWSVGFPGDHQDNSLSVANKITTIKKPIYQNFQDSLENSSSKVVPPSNSSSDDSIDEKIIKMKAKMATADQTSERAFRAISWEPKIHKFSMKLDDIINSEMYSKDSLECSSEISNDSSSVASAISYFMRLKDFNESTSSSDKNTALNEQPEDDLTSVGSYEEFEALLLRRPSDSMSKIKSREV